MGNPGNEDTEKEVEDPKAAALKKKTDLINAQKDLLEAQKGLVAAALPTAESKATEGSAESTDGDLSKLAELAAYSAMNECVQHIAAPFDLTFESLVDRSGAL